MSEKLDVPPSRMRMLKLVIVLFGALHLCACFFWRVKVLHSQSQAAPGAAWESFVGPFYNS